MVLVDTSVWIDFFAGKDCAHVARLEELIGSGQDLCICGLVLTETLQGIRNEQELRKTREYLKDLIYLEMPRSVFLAAADMFRALRASGVTIRSTVDCVIAAVCFEHRATLLQNDRDFEAIAGRYALRIDA